MTTTTEFNATPKENLIIYDIVRRAEDLGVIFSNRVSLMMDLDACHSNGCRLDLLGLLLADDHNFTHDIAGIQRHIDRFTGKLGDCFVPRFAEREGVK